MKFRLFLLFPIASAGLLSVLGCESALPLTPKASESAPAPDASVATAERSASAATKAAADAHAVLEKVEKNLKEARDLAASVREGEQQCRSLIKAVPKKVKCPECNCEAQASNSAPAATPSAKPGSEHAEAPHSAAPSRPGADPDFSKNDAP